MAMKGTSNNERNEMQGCIGREKKNTRGTRKYTRLFWFTELLPTYHGKDPDKNFFFLSATF